MRKHLVIILVVAASNRINAEDVNAEHLLNRAAPAWESYRSFVKRLDGNLTETTVHGDANRTSRSRTEVRWNNAWASYVFVPESFPDGKAAKLRSLALAVNSQYGFRLQRGQVEEPWSLTHLVPAAQVKLLPNFPPAWGIMHHCFEDAIRFALDFDRLPDLCGSPGFRLHKLSEEVKDGETLLRVDFSSSPGAVKDVTIDGQPHRRGYQAIRGGHFFLDPMGCYTIRAFELQCEEPRSVGFTYSGRIDYRRSIDGFPILLKRVTESRDAKGKLLSQKTREYDLKEDSPPPESAFTLSAFGLPEPAEYRRPTPWYWYLAAGGLIAVIGAAVVRRRWTRNS